MTIRELKVEMLESCFAGIRALVCLILVAAPDKVKLVDVRTPEEYAFIGHPEMAWNIPFAFVTYQRKNGKTEYGPKMNPDFVAEVKTIAGMTDILLLMCRSGDRSARAVDKLAAAGFKNAYTIIDGFEGDKVMDTLMIGITIPRWWVRPWKTPQSFG